MYGIKLDNASFTLDIPSLTNKQATVYILNSNDSTNLASKTSMLNGRAIEWDTHQPDPDLNGVVVSLPIQIPGYSQFFIVANQSSGTILSTLNHFLATQCPFGWTSLTTSKNKCVNIINDTQAMFSAKFSCSTYGYNSSILSIDSAFENAEILSTICMTLSFF